MNTSEDARLITLSAVRSRGSLGRWILGCCLLLCATASAADNYEQLRREMISEIEQDTRDTAFYINQERLDERVIQVMSEIPRHRFVPAEARPAAYENRPLPIGHGQTISQPYVVALMTDLLRPQPEHRVLELGTGSGYQAAILSRLVAKVYTIEIIEQLGTKTADLLRQLGYHNIDTRIADGYYGWPEAAPFDSIIVTAAASQIPPPLIGQLKPGGRMVIPLGGRFQVQQLMLIEKSTEGRLTTRQILPVRFVPLTGDH